MAALERFGPPGNLSELSEDGRIAWSERVSGLIEDQRNAVGPGSGEPLHPQFFNPLRGGDAEAAERPVVWPAFPGRLAGGGAERWERADGSREEQDEYCEWGVERSGEEIVRVTFTTETPDYFQHLLETDRDLLLALYEEFSDAQPSIAELTDAKGRLDWANDFNRAASGAIAHLSQSTNNLFAAVALVAQATVLREKNGMRIVDKKALCRCNGLGDENRNSDPQIAIAVNQIAAEGEELSLADPPGLYIDEFLAGGMRTPDGADAADFWQVTRGDAAHALRAKFEVPAERGYSVSEIEIDGRPIEFGAQLAERVRVRVLALSRPGGHQPVPRPCEE